MKKIIIILLLVTSAISAQKNKYKHSLNGIKKVRIESNTILKISSGNTSSLIIDKLQRKNKKNSTNNVVFHNLDCNNWSRCGNCNDFNKKKAEKRKGLTAIYPGGKDNTNGFGYSLTKVGTTLLVKDLKSHIQRNGIQFYIPKNIDIAVETGSLGSVFLKGFSSEVEVETKVGKIVMEDVTGPVTAHSSVGNITINFSNINQTSPITITSSTSEIDVALPANTKASLDMKTRGTVYTNFDLQAPTKDELKDISNKKIVGNINNGGVKIRLKSSMGNIYLRKK